MDYDFSLVKQFKDELIALIDYSFKVDMLTGFREVGASICEDESGKLHFAYGGVSEKPYIAELGKCSKGEKVVVDFHTHDLSTQFSKEDILASKERNAEIACIGIRRKQRYEFYCLKLKDMSSKKFCWVKPKLNTDTNRRINGNLTHR